MLNFNATDDRESWINRCNALEMALEDDKVNHNREVQRLRKWIEEVKIHAPSVINGFGHQLNHASPDAASAVAACKKLELLLKETP